MLKELAGVGYYPNTCLQFHCFFTDRVQSLIFDVWTNSKIPLDIEMGVTLTEQQGDTSIQNYARKLKAILEWAYQVAHENNQKKSEHHKKYYEKRVRCMSLKPDGLVLVHVKALSGDHKIADQWEETPQQVVSQLADQPFFEYSQWML